MNSNSSNDELNDFLYSVFRDKRCFKADAKTIERFSNILNLRTLVSPGRDESIHYLTTSSYIKSHYYFKYCFAQLATLSQYASHPLLFQFICHFGFWPSVGTLARLFHDQFGLATSLRWSQGGCFHLGFCHPNRHGSNPVHYKCNSSNIPKALIAYGKVHAFWWTAFGLAFYS